jgi:hypothetical protein
VEQLPDKRDYVQLPAETGGSVGEREVIPSPGGALAESVPRYDVSPGSCAPPGYCYTGKVSEKGHKEIELITNETQALSEPVQ